MIGRKTKCPTAPAVHELQKLLAQNTKEQMAGDTENSRKSQLIHPVSSSSNSHQTYRHTRRTEALLLLPMVNLSPMQEMLIPLPDGRIVDLGTESGANAYLQTESPKIARAIRTIYAKPRLKVRDKAYLVAMNGFLEIIAHSASKEVFREHVEEITVKAWLDDAIKEIKHFSTSRDWIDTGKLPAKNSSLLDSIVPMMRHAVPVSLAFKQENSEFFKVLADFVQDRKGATGRALPCDDICLAITWIIESAYYTKRVSCDKNWTAEQALKKLEATGVLEQFIRCATVPDQNSTRHPTNLRVLVECQECTLFISEKVQKGQPCHNVIVDILEGRDGSAEKRPHVLNQLKTIIGIADYTIKSEHDERHDGGSRCCDHCQTGNRSKEFQESLMKCARCLQKYYCSKKCQRADWKLRHKVDCVPATKKTVAKNENLNSTIHNFTQRQYIHIMVEMVKACEQTGLSKNDLVVVLDFTANANGIVPAMQEPPEFKIAPTKAYLAGQECQALMKQEALPAKKKMSRSVLPSQFYFWLGMAE